MAGGHQGTGMPTPPDDARMLCYCKNVRYGEVRRVITEIAATRVAQVTERCDAGGGCRTCHPEIQELIDEHRAARPRAGLVGFLKRFVFRS